VGSPSMLRTFGMKVLRGRDFSEGEFAEPSAIVDTRTARFLFPGADPIGRMIKMGPLSSRAPWLRIVGLTQEQAIWRSMVRNEADRALPGMGAVYVLDTDALAFETRPFEMSWLYIQVRGTGDAQRLPLLVQRQLAPMRSEVRLFNIGRYVDRLGLTRDRARNSFVASLFAVFAVLGLAVALMGVYAVVAQAVAQREREFAVRKALGAGDRDIRRHVFAYGRVPCLLGIALGLLVTWKSVGLLYAFLSSESDVYASGTFGLVSLGFLAMSLLATYVPARRAVRLEPVIALRHE
jgi:putative ABC transport system permease protein